MQARVPTQRERERQKLLNRLMRGVRREAKKRGDPQFPFRLIVAITEYLAQRAHNTPRHNIPEETSFFIGKILGPISAFAGASQVEDDALVAMMLTLVVQFTTLPFQEDLRDEDYSPKDMFLPLKKIA